MTVVTVSFLMLQFPIFIYITYYILITYIYYTRVIVIHFLIVTTETVTAQSPLLTHVLLYKASY